MLRPLHAAEDEERVVGPIQLQAAKRNGNENGVDGVLGRGGNGGWLEKERRQIERRYGVGVGSRGPRVATAVGESAFGVADSLGGPVRHVGCDSRLQEGLRGILSSN